MRRITALGVAAIQFCIIASALTGCGREPEKLDGQGAAASFKQPTGLATDRAGNIYVADLNHYIIRKITPSGMVTTFAGNRAERGDADGVGAAASFRRPNSIATDASGNIYVGDTDANVIRKITPAGVVTTLAGTAGVTGHADGFGAAASFDAPAGIATDIAGNVYVADLHNDTIRKISPAGMVTTFAGTAGESGVVDGIGQAARFDGPGSVATDNAGNIYVAEDTTIRKISPEGVVTTLAGMPEQQGYADGEGGAARFKGILGIATDSAGNVYVAEMFNHTIRKITPSGVVTTFAGQAGKAGYSNGSSGAAKFRWPSGLACDSAGNVYVSDIEENVIRKITPAGIVTTLAGNPL
jgi:sugar lactone lactonase YvrE